MAREIRITVDDDEVFERMKRRKNDLDLSWEEVLYRGLDERPDEDIGERLGRQIESHVADTIRSSLGISGVGGGRTRPPKFFEYSGDFDRPEQPAEPEPPEAPEPPEPPEPQTADLESEMERLANAEDATLTFDSLPDESAYAVPLRVNLATSPDGLDVDVVAVRGGKAVAGTNRFTGDARRTVTRELATGGTARLELGDGAESYDVRAALTWGRHEDGTPTVTDVEITDVVFDADE